jgi:hypothetical protein
VSRALDAPAASAQHNINPTSTLDKGRGDEPGATWGEFVAVPVNARLHRNEIAYVSTTAERRRPSPTTAAQTVQNRRRLECVGEWWVIGGDEMQTQVGSAAAR